MRLSPRPPTKRHRAERFPYDRMFDGRPWLLSPKDFGGRTQAKVYDLIRQAAWRRRLVVTIEFDGKDLIVQATQGPVAQPPKE